MRFLHLSDLHIHSQSSTNKAVADTLDYVRDHYPDHNLIITGDITDDGSPDQYRQAKKLLAPFSGRMFFCPGNHDYGAVGNLFSRDRARAFDEMLSVPFNQGGTFAGDCHPVVNMVRDGDGEVLLIALDSNLETQQPFDFACGEIGATQLADLDALLTYNRPANTPVFLFFHHHPYDYHSPFMELKDAPSLARVAYSRVNVMLFGHRHVSDMWMQNRWNIPYILAADNSPGKQWAREISVTGTTITVKDVPIA